MTLTAPDQAWVADFTYIRLRRAFVYLACLLDAFSRRCVGWHLSREMTTQLTRNALHQAIVERHPKPGLIHHSDRRVQYASREYVEQLQAIRAQSSMSAVGNPYKNAKAESFFKTLKAEQNLTAFIEKVYNEKRLLQTQPLHQCPEVDFPPCPAKCLHSRGLPLHPLWFLMEYNRRG